MDNTKLIKNINRAKHKVDSILGKYSKANDIKLNKKANLLSYWIVDYLKMIDKEQTFKPNLLKKYKRGDILKVNLGFNIGHEEGGLHYVVVVSNSNANSSDLLTIVPLTSKKPKSKITKYDIDLGTTLYDRLDAKLNDEMYILKKKLTVYHDKEQVLNKKISKLIKATYDNSQKPMDNPKLIQALDEYQKLIMKIDSFNNDIATAHKDQTELIHMKSGSIALVGQITTISKLRIHNPKNTHEALHGIRLSNEELNLIDNKILELYTKKVK